MSYESKIAEIVDKYCYIGKQTSLHLPSLEYKVQGKVTYLANLNTIANLLTRPVTTVLEYIKPKGLKTYTLKWKGESLYGFIVIPKLRVKISTTLEQYIETIKCKQCSSRFTQLVESYTVCKSCGAKY